MPRYTSHLFRAADAAGLSAHVTLLARGTPVDVIRAGLLGSEENFRREGGTNDGFLAALYRDVLGREIDVGGRANWLGLLARGWTRYGVALALLRSAEGLTAKVQGLYRQYLRREADAGGLANFVGLLRRGMPEPAVAAALVGSPEYAARP